MSKRLSTLGMTLSYAVEATAGTRPTTAAAYTEIPEVKSIPNLNPQPNGIDVTPLSETEYVLYTNGLKDLGGALEFQANLTDDVITAWETMITAYETGIAADKATWFCVQHPELSKAVYFTGDPAPIGLNDAAVNSALNTSLFIAPSSAPEMAAKPA